MERLDFKKYLEPDEKILWQGIQTKKTTAKLITPVLFILVPIIILFAYIPLMDYVDTGAGIGLGVTMAILSSCSIMCIGSIYYSCFFIPNLIRVPRAEYIVTNKGIIRVMGNRMDVVRYCQISKPMIYTSKNRLSNIVFNDYLITNLFNKRNGKKGRAMRYFAYVGKDKDFFAIESISDADKVLKIIESQMK